ncbi:phosphate-starvation-inducible PsiE family protein [Pleurocapsales cyanobacterium LEGE 10410]|nr:phosphate-starvation-inducible PsiE family protein [Pleurocapsales cyanobacterium LEGE 10410]
MTKPRRGVLSLLKQATKDSNYLKLIHLLENFVAKILSLTLSIVILIALGDLVYFLIQDAINDPKGFYNKSLIELFGSFLNILIALELLENITVYLKKHVVQLELVIVTSLIAVARKIIIFDLEKYSDTDLMALGIAIVCLAASYWLIKTVNMKNKSE